MEVYYRATRESPVVLVEKTRKFGKEVASCTSRLNSINQLYSMYDILSALSHDTQIFVSRNYCLISRLACNQPSKQSGSVKVCTSSIVYT